MHLPVPTFALLALLPLAACGGADADTSHAAKGDHPGPAVVDETGPAMNLIRIEVGGETFEAESRSWGPNLEMGLRELTANFDVKLDDEYMGERIHLRLRGGEIREGTFLLVPDSSGMRDLEADQASLVFAVSTRPALEECRARTGTLTITHLEDETEDKRYRILELDGTFEAEFSQKGTDRGVNASGAFRYRR